MTKWVIYSIILFVNKTNKVTFFGIVALVGIAVSFLSCQEHTKEFDYEGLTFSYSSNWKASPETVEEDWVYFVDCKRKGLTSTEHISVTWVWDTEDTTPMELIENVLAQYKELFTEVNPSEFYSSIIGSFECISTDVDLIFSLTVPELPFKFPIPSAKANLYVTISAFASDEHTVVLVKVADKREKLSSAEFQLIVDTLDIW